MSLEGNAETTNTSCVLRGKIRSLSPYAVDKTLAVEGAAADAKATGEAVKKATQEATTYALSHLNSHANNEENPHNVTKTQVGLGKVDNTSDADKPVSTAQQKAITDAVRKVRAEKAETETYKGTLSASGWSTSAPFTQQIAVGGILSTDYPFVDIDLSEVTDAMSVIEGWNLVGRVTVSADNALIAYAYEEAPAVDIPIVLKVVR